MTIRFNSKLIDAAPNVVRLPTAASRQVKQNYNREAAGARRSLREAAPWPGEYRHPSDRAMDELAALLLAIEPTPASELLRAILSTLDDEARATVAKVLAPGVVCGRESARQAFALLRSTKLTVGDQHYLGLALDRQRKREM
jgi:hypothetical protein